MSPKFQATNKHVPGETRAPPPPTPPNDVPSDAASQLRRETYDVGTFSRPRRFKATVMLFLNGGIDSWTSLVPKEGCIRDETNRTLWEQSRRRAPIKLSRLFF